MKREKVLVIAAHPDDEVLGCGGMIARLSKEGHAVHVLVLGEGMTSRLRGAPQMSHARACAALHRQARRAVATLGVEDIRIHRFPDNQFDTVPLLDIIQCIELHVQRVMPALVFTHWDGDLNMDHTLTNRATLIAVRPGVSSPVTAVYAYEVPSSSEWGASAFKATYYVDISDVIDRKVDALKVYTSEIRSYPHPRSEHGIRHLAAVRGMECGRPFAEGFRLLRAIR